MTTKQSHITVPPALFSLKLHDSHRRETVPFLPEDPAHIRLYFCGPTVYDRVHLGNLRSMLSADIMVRLLHALYERVTYVRNITDIDDKIIQRAAENGEDITHLTERTTKDFHQDLAALNILPPTIEPRATHHIPDMLAMIERLITQGHAYEADGHVLFDVTSFPSYGALSGRSLEDMQAGARVEVADYKRHPGDFVLWKPSNATEPGWDSPYGRGRPGWHIECSAMAERYLGESFDIHGGGNDLLFPHHENERAQSLCCHPHSHFARHWLHTGMLLSGGEKMSKSLGNFHTIHEVLERAPAEALRLLFLGAHYRSTLDFTWEKLEEARHIMDRFYRALEKTPATKDDSRPVDVLNALCDDLNTPQALSILHRYADAALEGQQEAANQLLAGGQLLGLFTMSPTEWFQGGTELDPATIDALIEKRLAARKVRDFALADQIRNDLAAQGILLEDGPNGTTWRKG
ncbi:cysteine--tRNA ligase [Bombella sp. ESL0378]|uniref:cysteine--tRNA ligase n=1 Tax=unclassified Bombella TaxID=2644098 RepID=UPI0012D876EA|nr:MULTISPECIES: cysteine--tRNA ligase [unclassified Bombella]MUG04391.1 cysteine--tRNA ligase [Bombella sp. ESL0378]MUG89886.1 cysteine--tRNA ligase [Bombella sp. ESL0385]